MSLDEVFHHCLKLRITFAGLIHHHANHVQDVRALRINQKLVGAAGLGAVQTITLRHRTDCVRLALSSGPCRSDDSLSLVFPEVDELADVFADVPNVKRRGKLSKPLAHPLVAITVPADDMSPPLMCDFVRLNVTPEIICSDTRAHQLRALRAIDEC